MTTTRPRVATVLVIALVMMVTTWCLDSPESSLRVTPTVAVQAVAVNVTAAVVSLVGAHAPTPVFPYPETKIAPPSAERIISLGEYSASPGSVSTVHEPFAG